MRLWEFDSSFNPAPKFIQNLFWTRHGKLRNRLTTESFLSKFLKQTDTSHGLMTISQGYLRGQKSLMNKLGYSAGHLVFLSWSFYLSLRTLFIIFWRLTLADLEAAPKNDRCCLCCLSRYFFLSLTFLSCRAWRSNYVGWMGQIVRLDPLRTKFWQANIQRIFCSEIREFQFWWISQKK